MSHNPVRNGIFVSTKHEVGDQASIGKKLINDLFRTCTTSTCTAWSPPTAGSRSTSTPQEVSELLNRKS